MKKLWKAVVLLCMTLMCSMLWGHSSKAAVKPVKLSNNKAITKYDLNNDGKRDTLLIKGTQKGAFDGQYMKWEIQINGKTCLRQNHKSGTMFSVVLYKVSSSRIYLFISDIDTESSGYVEMQKLYQVKGSGLKQCLDFHTKKLMGYQDFHFDVGIKKVTSKSMTVNCFNQLGALGSVNWEVIYKYKSGRWIPSGKTYKVVSYLGNNNKTVTANKKISLKVKPGGKRVAFTLKPGERAKIRKVCIKKKHIYIQFTRNGKSGWLQSPKTYKDGNYFAEEMYAG